MRTSSCFVPTRQQLATTTVSLKRINVAIARLHGISTSPSSLAQASEFEGISTIRNTVTSSVANVPAIIKLHLQGVSAREIHQRLGVHCNVIYRTSEGYRELGTEDDRSGRGRRAIVATTGNIRKAYKKNKCQKLTDVKKEKKEKKTF
ncbi:unnamed protein product [Haemonchus placei]|uniref:HTH_Tnp_Tc3_1 domain-containing protein n=1 Tax=Haemonchus placei TaxID=6290 RepID=A0A158QNW2_HAEPC|nr:unnamed protein product [Haemonchus placei]